MLAWLEGCLQDIAVFLARSFDRFLEGLFASRNPGVVLVRETIRNNRFLISKARGFIRAVRTLPTLQRRIREKKTFPVRRLHSVMAARAVGGSVTALELERIWSVTRRGARVLVIAEGPELDQIEIVLKAVRARATFCSEVGNLDVRDFDLTIVAPVHGLERQLAGLEKRSRPVEKFLRVGETAKRSDYFAARPAVAAIALAADRDRRPMQERIARGEPLRVVFLNDVGFQYGAGIALKRQVASLLLKGWEVSVVAWLPGDLRDPPMVTGVRDFGGWRGVSNVGEYPRGKAGDENQAVAEILSTILALEPDVIITGNLHSARGSLDLAQGLKTIDALVVSYMHDCFWATGRCAYPVSCQLYQTGCNETCPTADEYPKLAREKIGAAWRTKADIFEGESGIPLVTNSGWTRDLAVRRFGGRARIDCVPLAVDHELFAPIPKAVARRLLGLPAEGTFIVMGAVDILNKWKGGDLFRAIHEKLQNRNDVSVLLFGQSSALLKSTRSFGLVEDERLMPFILNSADILVGTATEEAFGQTLLEAAACGTPVVAFNRGGVGDIVVNEETGLLVENLSVIELYTAINRLLADPALRERLGSNARKRVEAHFTLTKQADAWISYLKTLSSSQHR
jgi:glycosyltransferase involved in cell wall biosynthesis